MTAPYPSPAEQAVIDRFGIFDEERAADPLALLDQLDELRAAATPGPWAQHPSDGEYVIGQVGEDDDGELAYLDVADTYSFRSKRGCADAALIVAAVNALPDLLAAVRAGLALADELDGERDGYGYAIRNGLKPGPGDRIRAAISAALDPS